MKKDTKKERPTTTESLLLNELTTRLYHRVVNKSSVEVFIC